MQNQLSNSKNIFRAFKTELDLNKFLLSVSNPVPGKTGK
jgi:hypothetical protein